MDISGDDYVIFTCENPHTAVANYIASLQLRWPQLSIDYTEPDYRCVYSGINAPADCSETVKTRNRSSLYFYCTDGLRDYHETDGYTLNADGVGPFALFIRRRHAINFSLTEVIENHSDRDLSMAGIPEPYTAQLISNYIYEITLVTPSDGEGSEFNNYIISLLSISLCNIC